MNSAAYASNERPINNSFWLSALIDNFQKSSFFSLWMQLDYIPIHSLHTHICIYCVKEKNSNLVTFDKFIRKGQRRFFYIYRCCWYIFIFFRKMSSQQRCMCVLDESERNATVCVKKICLYARPELCSDYLCKINEKIVMKIKINLEKRVRCAFDGRPNGLTAALEYK